MDLAIEHLQDQFKHIEVTRNREIGGLVGPSEVIASPASFYQKAKPPVTQQVNIYDENFQDSTYEDDSDEESEDYTEEVSKGEVIGVGVDQEEIDLCIPAEEVALLRSESFFEQDEGGLLLS